MDLDELAQRISAASHDPVVQRLVTILREWKHDETTVVELRESVERYLGNSWIESTNEHEDVYAQWSKFREETINLIDGMTMNERLSSFGLFRLFDACETDDDRARLYSKLLASP